MSAWGQRLALLQLQNTYAVFRENIVVCFIYDSFFSCHISAGFRHT